eukprot:CAMPEP_0197827516 /NCGR_PEP_ID=MMETSP1437-20131217/4262_1 /TAXON_ID=49252 ORGANISM="Eucampia antarctica, Strain CCMP1452" /NCGR_SAMPLE_ID=MMETSP1437 /ASSEMBLY_ACC=CAM_ASM_001096 /LENGTH=638 /DNA_ID=CAMNT_0043428371 /DNA_START=272 /DNA_END=2188 /DNA_ORIENTATION=+
MSTTTASTDDAVSANNKCNGELKKEEDDKDKNNNDDIPENKELIVEGQARMLYPKGLVFYNPVQVQNRDVSILMCNMHVERRAKRQMMQTHKKKIYRQAREDIIATLPDTLSKNDRDRLIDSRMDREKIQKELSEMESSTDWAQHVRDKTKEDTQKGGVRILDALAASGLRSIRYWKEIPHVKQVVINDMDEAAVDLAKENVCYNQVQDVLLDDESDDNKYGIKVQLGDATHVMYMARRPPNIEKYTPTQLMQNDQFDIVDLDPYGSAAPFLDAAVQSVVHGGMINVTCTDMAALGGAHPETCYGRYAAMPIPQGKYLQELALRILLHSIATTAAKYGRTIKPILSVGMHFYIRVFVEVYDDKAGVNALSLSIGTVYQSTRCPSFHVVPHGQHGNKSGTKYQPARAPTIPNCEETGAPFKTAGPLWLGPLHDLTVVDEAVRRLENPSTKYFTFPLKTQKPLHGLLTSVSEELSDIPLYYTIPDLCKTVGCPAPPTKKFNAAIINAGYRVSGYHKVPNAIKTDAPNYVVWDIMRAWCQQYPPKKVKEKKNKKTGENSSPEGKGKFISAAEKILSIEPKIKVDFTIPEGSSQQKKAQRFPPNPEANWGPKSRATGYKRKSETNDVTNNQIVSETKVSKLE